MCVPEQKAIANQGVVWRPDDTVDPVPAQPDLDIYRPDVLKVIEDTIAQFDEKLRELSLDIHAHPELGFEEHRTHNVLTDFTEKHGFTVTRHYLMETAWRATFTHGSGGRVIGINSEMDALKGIGHACGHNLIAISGVAVALGVKAALEHFDVAGSVLLLGTPFEEGGGGKVILLGKGAYREMDVCLMSHPAPGPKGSVSLSSCLAHERLNVEYFGHTAHAALSPWEGKNALDAAVLGYNNISALRQQLKPTHRVHGIFEGKDWYPNIIPDYAKFICLVRAPTRSEKDETRDRVINCFKAAALATGCEIKIESPFTARCHDIRQNEALGNEVANIVLSKYGTIDYIWGIHSASTDFGNVTYDLPSLHPGFAIPTILDGGNHTPGFTEAASTLKAHYACLDVSKALAATAMRVILDDSFFDEVKAAFEKDKESRGDI